MILTTYEHADKSIAHSGWPEEHDGSDHRILVAGRAESCPAAHCASPFTPGIDPVSGRRHYLREVVQPGPTAAAEAQRVKR